MPDEVLIDGVWFRLSVTVLSFDFSSEFFFFGLESFTAPFTSNGERFKIKIQRTFQRYDIHKGQINILLWVHPNT
jgi:hypothetical protein